MLINETDIRAITESVWSSLLGLAIDAQPGPSPSGMDPVISAFVVVSGGWEGAVMVQCSPVLACRSAAIMFDTTPEAISAGDRNDALGEIANMVGGNVKALLPGSCTLSIPTVVDGDASSSSALGGHVLHRAAFATGGDELLILVIARSPGGDPIPS